MPAFGCLLPLALAVALRTRVCVRVKLGLLYWELDC